MGLHVTPSRFRVFLAVLLLLVAASKGGPTWARQDSADRTVPTELVDFLVDNSGRSNPAFFPGEIPEELRDVFRLPANATVIGSFAGRYLRRAFIEAPGSVTSSVRFYRQSMPARGWRHQPRRLGSKFFADIVETYCHEDATSASVRVVEQEAGVLLALTHSPFECRPQEDPNPYDVYLLLDRVPDLHVSREISIERGGGNRSDRTTGIGRAESATAVLRSRLPPRSILGHFGPQLSDVGWVPSDEWTGAQSAGQTWHAGFDDGLQLILFLSAVELGDDLVHASLRVVQASE